MISIIMEGWNLMKKILSVIVLLSLCFGLCACDDADSAGSLDQGVAQNNSGLISYNSFYSVFLEGLGEYRHFLRSHNVPDDFVSYHTLSAFGDFVSLYFPSPAPFPDDYSSYMYSLKTIYNEKFALYVDYDNQKCMGEKEERMMARKGHSL